MSATDNLIITLLVILAVDCVIFFGQTAMNDINPTGTQLYEYSGSILQSFDSDHNQNFTTILPEAEQSVGESGDFFTDTFLTTKSWLVSAGRGLSVLYGFFTAPVFILQSMNAPSILIESLRALWFGITIFLVVAFILGR